jgi:hypothetical protein
MKLFKVFLICCTWVTFLDVHAQENLMAVEDNKSFHDKITKGIKLFPGQWRPNFASEQIAWITPPWSSRRPEYGQEFIYLDFPEAIKVGKTMVYLSHVHPRFPAVYNYDLGKVDWIRKENRIRYERKLPNGLRFDGSITIKDPSLLELKIGITNNTGRDLDSIFLQTCAFLHPIREFSSQTDSNKFVFIEGKGWTDFATAETAKDNSGKYFFGWLGGVKNVRLPFVIVKSAIADRYVVFSWLDNSYSFIGNAGHPCFHSDPWFPDVRNNSREEIKGFLLFHEGSLSSLEEVLRKRFPQYYRP